MKKFAVIGNPVKHSLSPLLHSWVFNELNINASYEKIKLELNELHQIIDNLKKGLFDGVNVTIPYKESFINLLDEINPRATTIGSVNCVINSNGKLIGNNTDWYGFSKALSMNDINVKNKQIIVLGAGGTAKSIIYSLKNIGVTKIFILNRTYAKIKLLEDNLINAIRLEQITDIINKDSIIINTTSVGMNKDASLIDFNLLNKSQIIIDVIYTPLQTALIKEGLNLGAKTLNGLDMFIYQALASLDLWFGKSISKQVNFDQLKYYLERKIC